MVKTKIQAFNDIFYAAVLSVPVCGEYVEVTERTVFDFAIFVVVVVVVVVLGLTLFEKSLRLLHFLFKFLQISSHNPL